MNVLELRQYAQDLYDKASRVVNYTEQYPLDEAWRELEELFEQAKLLVGKHARIVSLEDYPKDWRTILERSDYVMALCDQEQPPAGEITGDYGG